MGLTIQKSKPKHRSWRGVESLPGSEHVACVKRSIQELERSIGCCLDHQAGLLTKSNVEVGKQPVEVGLSRSTPRAGKPHTWGRAER